MSSNRPLKYTFSERLPKWRESYTEPKNYLDYLHKELIGELEKYERKFGPCKYEVLVQDKSKTYIIGLCDEVTRNITYNIEGKHCKTIIFSYFGIAPEALHMLGQFDDEQYEKLQHMIDAIYEHVPYNNGVGIGGGYTIRYNHGTDLIEQYIFGLIVPVDTFPICDEIVDALENVPHPSEKLTA